MEVSEESERTRATPSARYRTVPRGALPSPTRLWRCTHLPWISTIYRRLTSDMAWRCSGTTNVELVQNMARNGIITSDRVVEVRSDTNGVIHRGQIRLRIGYEQGRSCMLCAGDEKGVRRFTTVSSQNV